MDGRDEFIGKLVTANPQMKPLLETILSKDALKEMAEPTFAVVPGKAVAKGEKWTRKSNLNMGPIGQYENVYTYEYEGSDKDLAKIKVDTQLTYKEPGDTAGAGGLPFKIKSGEVEEHADAGAEPGHVQYQDGPARAFGDEGRAKGRTDHRDRWTEHDGEPVADAGLDHRDDGRRPDEEEVSATVPETQQAQGDSPWACCVSRFEIEDGDAAISTADRGSHAVGGDGEGEQGAEAEVQGVATRGRRHVPELDDTVATGGKQGAAVGTEGEAADGGWLTDGDGGSNVGERRENQAIRVVAAGEPAAIARDGKVMNPASALLADHAVVKPVRH